MLEVAVIADDLTGAADTGVQFCPLFPGALLISYRNLSSNLPDPMPRAISVYTNSRAEKSESARKRVEKVIREILPLNPGWIYKKVDSCLRGNIGAEVDAVMDEGRIELAFVAPAFPEMGRTTVHDIHQVDNTPVALTELSRDPVTPVVESGLSQTLASQSRRPVGHVDLRFLEQGGETAFVEVRRLVDSGVKLIAFDVVSNGHLDTIVHTASRFEEKSLLVGSGGLAKSLADHCRSGMVGEELHPSPALGQGSHLLVCGTVSERTGIQISRLLDTYPYRVISLSPDLLDEGSPTGALSGMAAESRRLLAENDLIIRIERAAGGDFIGQEISQRAERIVQGLGLFVASVVEGAKISGIFLTGGDTATAVLERMSASAIRLHGEIVTGMPRGTIIGGLLDGTSVITKAGAFGDDSALLDLHEYWVKDQR